MQPLADSAGLLYEYSAAASPSIPPVAYTVLAPVAPGHETVRRLWDNGPALGMAHPGTTPALACYQVAVQPGRPLACTDRATSTLVRIASGRGTISLSAHGAHAASAFRYGPGDILVLPGPAGITWQADESSSGMLITDEPLLAYLGVVPSERRVAAIHYREAELLSAIAGYRAEAAAAKRNRCGVILGQAATADTKTVSRSLWSLLNILPANTVQKPHRHQSVAIDIAVSGSDGVYTLMAPAIRADGSLIDPIRATWVAGAAFITPPGWWHSHHNETGQDAMVFPVQDAGLHTYLRSLDIQFVG